MDDKAEKVALFRYGLIAPLVLETLPRGELTRRAQELAARLYDIPHSARRQVSVDTLLDWSLRYRRNGLAALSPKPRQDRGLARAVAPETAALIERLKRENPHRTGAALLRELALANQQNQAGLSASTLYRFLRARGLTERQLLLDKATAHKKYEAQFANQIWQSDMLFGPWVERPGGGKQQVFLQAALDDASRLIPHAQFYPNQGLDAFLDCLRQAIAARGIPTRLYMDNAKIYRSPQLARIAASIGILIVHTPPYQPEGRGKIERFFRSVREQFLASLGLLRIGFLHHQQIFWNKERAVLNRSHYWFQHEPCWYVRKKNAPWFGKAGENSTVWDSPSPKFIMGGSDEEKFDHPTQKPVELMRRPILNHTHRGELVYDPFLGSGSTLAASELTERVCYGMEIDPRYVDVIITRWQKLAGKPATLEGEGSTFDEITAERKPQLTSNGEVAQEKEAAGGSSRGRGVARV